ncbi:Multidrug resistance-associated protein 4 [Nymphon striatum]|nr:Multidrug resistance-associated protein 4 [Nymphon striatum]
MDTCLIEKENSVKKLNLFSKLFFTWTFPILRKGWKKNLKFKDYTEIPSNLRTNHLDKEFSKFYGMKKPSVWALIWTLFKVAQNNVLTSWFCGIVMELVQKPLQSLLISLLLAEQQKKEDYEQSTALLYAISTCFLVLLHPLVYHQCLFNIVVAGMNIRSTLSSAIYKKITRMSQQGFMRTNSGEIMNILSNDMDRFTTQDLQYTFFVITSPLQCIIVCVILWLNIGALPIIGVFGFLIMIPLQILFGRSLFKFRKRVLKATDARIKLIYEIITSMKIIKLYAWEDSLWKHIFEKRKHEFKQLRRILLLNGASCVIFKSMVNVVILLSMFGFVLQNKNEFPVPKVYLAITMFYSVKYSISEFFADGLNGIAQLLSSIQRIYNFLSIEEYPSGIIQSLNENIFIDSKLKSIVKLREVFSSYGKDTENVVKDISFKLNLGDSLCVIGEIGSGKVYIFLHFKFYIRTGTRKST